jgi:hypothetical protein
MSDWPHATPDHPHSNVVVKNFDRWNVALAAAGLTPAPPRRNTFKLRGKYAHVAGG